jgi:membrane protein DedA with SNARE-associated domain
VFEKTTDTAQRAKRSWFFTALLGVVGFFIGGTVVFIVGLHMVMSPPFPPIAPGTAACGNEILGSVWNSFWAGAAIMLFGTPGGAIVAAVAGAILGSVLDVTVGRNARRKVTATKNASGPKTMSAGK